MVIRLRGLTWDHPRGIAPLRACASVYRASHPGVELEWRARPLRSFEDTPVGGLAHGDDVVAVDHPFTGQAAASGDFLPLDDLLPAATVTALERDALGPSGASYRSGGRLWAVPIDAAAQAGVVRRPLAEAPKTWDDALAFIDELPSGAAWMAADPTHLWSGLLTLYRQFGGPADGPEYWPDGGLDAERLAAAVERLAALMAVLDPQSYRLDPIRLLDRMAGDDRIAYVPLVFGYVTYAGGDLAFVPPPRGDSPGTLLGGVGLAVSAHGSRPAAAAEFLAWVASGPVQAGTYAGSGGQPAHVAAWRDPGVDERAAGFYSALAEPVEHAFVRSRHPAYPALQRRVAPLLHDGLRSRAPLPAVVAQLSTLLCRPVAEPGDDHDH